MIRNYIQAAVLSLVISIGAGAATIDFVGAPTGVNDGEYYVLPYELTINGITQLVTCYDVFDDVHVGDTWQANLLNLGQAVTSGYFSSSPNALAGYERIAWLDTQTYTDSAQQIGLQYAIWNVFGTAPSTTEETAYNTAANAAAAGGYAGFNFNQFTFIEEVGGVPGQNGTKQAFVFSTPTPEPAAFLLCGVGVLALVLRKRIDLGPHAESGR
jgi:hypothetical protein